MRVIDLAQWFLPVVPRSRDDDAICGMPPGDEVLCFQDGQLVIVCQRKGNYYDGLLHELCHAILGPRFLQYEMPIMALQWRMMQLLGKRDFSACRSTFADYTLSSYPPRYIGFDDSFLHEPEWRKCVRAAKAAGVLTRRGSLSRRLRISHEWDSWLEVQLEAEQRVERMLHWVRTYATTGARA